MHIAFLEIMKEKINERQQCGINSDELEDMGTGRMKMIQLKRSCLGGLPGVSFEDQPVGETSSGICSICLCISVSQTCLHIRLTWRVVNNPIVHPMTQIN